MSSIQTYTVTDPDWATGTEYVIHQPKPGYDRDLASITIPPAPLPDQQPFLTAIITTPYEQLAPLDTRLSPTDPKGIRYDQDTSNPLYLGINQRLLIATTPGTWQLTTREGQFPYAVHTMLFHPATTTPPSGKCRVCKITAKALALAIVAALTLATIPHHLLLAVAAFLKVGPAVAAAFIASVVGDTASTIAEKLCTQIGLCP
jgi:hypothetical protein